MLILDEPRVVSPSFNNPVLAASVVGSYFFPSTTTSALPSIMRFAFSLQRNFSQRHPVGSDGRGTAPFRRRVRKSSARAHLIRPSALILFRPPRIMY